MRVRTYASLRQLESFEERYNYLRIQGEVGRATFGFDRWVNQKFYSSREWRNVRSHVILRDRSCDLGIEGLEIHGGLTIHHMNPITQDEILHGDEEILNPEYLITTTHTTHNAIHYGVDHKPNLPVVRKPGDTSLW
jgi:hypothetical protein